MNLRKLHEVFKFWIVLSVATTFLSLLILITAHQTLRQGANDPQIQLAEDLAAKLLRGMDTDQLVEGEKVNPVKSLDIITIIYSAQEEPIYSSAILDGKTPELPKGVLEHARNQEIHKLTWQPKDTVRIATVIKYFKGESEGYVLVGRSLKEVELRKEMVLHQAILGWAGTLVATFMAASLIAKTGKA